MVHIFVAEDSKLIRRVIKTIIEEHAFDVITSDDNKKNIEKFRQKGQEVLFLDITMSENKGINAIYDLIKSIPEAKVELYRGELPASKTDVQEEHLQQSAGDTIHSALDKTELAAIIDEGLATAFSSLVQMLKKDLSFTILQLEFINLMDILNYVPRTCLGAFYKINDNKNGAAILFQMKDIFSVFGLLQIDFTVSDNTIQDIINELGNIFMKSVLKVMNEMLQESFAIGDPSPATGDNIEDYFSGVVGPQNDVALVKFNFTGDNKIIEVYMVLSLPPS